MSDLYEQDAPTKVVRTLGNASEPDTDTLDPDLANWRIIALPIWPFSGAPTTGTWPKGWLGVDNTSTLYVCTVGGSPGTWVAVGGGGAAYASLTGTGETNAHGSLTQTGGFTVNDPTATGIQLITNGGGIALEDTVGGGISILADGGFNLESNGAGLGLTDASAGGIKIEETGTGGIELDNSNSGGITVLDSGDNGINIESASGIGSLTVQDAGGGLNITETGNAQLLINTTDAANTAGIEISDAGTGGLSLSVPKLGTFGVAPVARQSSTGITTVAQLVTVLKNYGLLS